MTPGVEKELEKAVRPAIEDIASDSQKMFDSFARSYDGRPVSKVKPVLRREGVGAQVDLSDTGLIG